MKETFPFLRAVSKWKGVFGAVVCFQIPDPGSRGWAAAYLPKIWWGVGLEGYWKFRLGFKSEKFNPRNLVSQVALAFYHVMSE